jgi:hypothetical protein
VERRVLPVALVAAAQLADLAGMHGLARAALLAALPFAAVAALVAFGDFLEKRGGAVAGLQAFCSWGIVAFLVLGCAVRSSALHGVPPLAATALVATISLFALKGILAAAPHARRLASFSPAKP